MRAPITVIVPTCDAAGQVAVTLSALYPALTEGLLREVILADAGSTDETRDMAEAAGARLVIGPSERGRRVDAAVAEAEGEWLLILDPGAELAGDWIGGLWRHMARDRAGAGYFPLRYRAAGLWPALKGGLVNRWARLSGRPAADHGLFLPRAQWQGGRVTARPITGLVEI